MNSKQALAQARKRWGKNAAVREYRGECSTPESREAATKRWHEIRALSPAEQKALRAEKEALQSVMHCRFRCTVGRVVMGLFFEVKGQGDNWTEAFEAADAAAEADRKRYAELRKEAA